MNLYVRKCLSELYLIISCVHKLFIRIWMTYCFLPQGDWSSDNIAKEAEVGTPDCPNILMNHHCHTCPDFKVYLFIRILCPPHIT